MIRRRLFLHLRVLLLLVIASFGWGISDGSLSSSASSLDHRSDRRQLVLAGPGGRSLLQLRDSELVESNTEFVVSKNGTILLVHKSGEVLWSFATGFPVHSSYRASANEENNKEYASKPSSSFFMDYYDGTELPAGDDSRYMRLRLGMSMEEFLKRMLPVSDDGIMLVSKTTTAFLLDGRSGRLIHVYKSLEASSVEKKNIGGLVRPKAENVVDLPLLITRTDSKLEHFDRISRELSWNLTVSDFSAALLCDPVLNSDQDLGPEIWNGVLMPLLCGMQTEIRWLTNSELFINMLQEGPLDVPLPSLPRLHNHHETKRREAPIPHRKSLDESNDGNLIYPNEESEAENSQPPQGAVFLYHLNNILGVLFERFAALSPVLFMILFVGGAIYSLMCSIAYCRSLFSEQKCIMRNMPKTSERKKACDAGSDNDTIEHKDKPLLSGYNDRFELIESGEKILPEFKNIYHNGNGGGRRIGKLFVSSKEIAKGSNGTVIFEGIYEVRPVAVKRLVQSHHEVAYKEIQNLIASDQHPNIVRWYGVEHDQDFVYLSLERCICSLGDLIQVYPGSQKNELFGQAAKLKVECTVRLDSEEGILQNLDLWKASGHPSPLLLKLMRDIISGLAHLHELGIIHRDLKPQNVLIAKSRSLCAKLSDMGISKRLPGDMSSLGHLTTGCGSSGWQAPEQLLHGRQTRAVDIFSLGCLLFFCLTGGKHPFGNHLERDVNIAKNNKDLFLIECIPEALDLVSCLLNPNPGLRPSAAEVLLHPLFWSPETRLSFLRDASDRVELENREAHSDLLDALEGTAPTSLGGKWDRKLEYAFISNIGQYRRYKFDSVRDLLRVIRNKLNHYRELPKEIQELVGAVPEGFDEYFRSRYPRLLIEVYRVIYKYCKEEGCFLKYFRSNTI